MFMVNEEQAALVRQAYFERGERAAVEKLRELFRALPDNENTLLCARSIASWEAKSQHPEVSETKIRRRTKTGITN